MAILQMIFCCALLCLAILQPTIQSTDYPIHRLSALICMAIPQTTLCCALFYLAILCTSDYLQCSAMSGVTTTDYPLCSTRLHCIRLSALPTIHSALSGDTLHPNIPYALLHLLILQATIQSTDYPLRSVWRYCKRLSAVLLSVLRFHEELNIYRRRNASRWWRSS
jgi:hypothetical protein